MLGAFGGPIGLAVTGLAFAIGTFAQRQQEAKQRVKDLTDEIDLQTGALKKNAQEALRNNIATGEVGKTAQKLGISLQDVFEAAQNNEDAFKRINDRIRELNPNADDYSKTVTRGAQANAALKGDIASVLGFIQQQRTDIDGATEAAKRKASVTIDGADAEKGYGDAIGETTGKAKDQAKAVRDAAQAVLDATAAKRAAFDAEIGYQQALDDVDAAIKENGKTANKNKTELLLNTDAQRANAKALRGQADEAVRVAEQNLKGGASLKSLRGDMDAAKKAFVDNAIKMGLSKKAAEDLAKEWGVSQDTVNDLAKSVEDLPASKQIKIEAEVAAAKKRLDDLKTLLAGLNSKSLVVDVTTRQRYVTERTANGGRNLAGGLTKADGGYISGPGTAKSDSIPAWLSNGEYVIKAAAVAKYGTSLLDHINAMRFAEGGAVRYAPQPVRMVAPSGPSTHTERYDQPIYVGTVVTPDAHSFRGDMQRRRDARYQRNARTS
jgi:hypothetical protein